MQSLQRTLRTLLEGPKEQIHVFKETEPGNVEILRPILQTFGANVGAISHFVFEDDLPNRLSKKLDRVIETKSSTVESLLQILDGELSTEALMLLKNKYLK